jgi:hypothetical protein
MAARAIMFSDWLKFEIIFLSEATYVIKLLHTCSRIVSEVILLKVCVFFLSACHNIA